MLPFSLYETWYTAGRRNSFSAFGILLNKPSLKFALPHFAAITFSSIWWPITSQRQPRFWRTWRNLTSSFRNHLVLIFSLSWEPLLNSGTRFSRTSLQGKELYCMVIAFRRIFRDLYFNWNMGVTFLLQWFWGNFGPTSLALHHTPPVSSCWLESTSQCPWHLH